MWLRGKTKTREYIRGHIRGPSKKNPILKFRRVVLIDERGTNLGEMDSDVALGVAEGRGFKVMPVKSGGEESSSLSPPFFRIVSQQSVYEEKKAKKRAKKMVPHDILKEVKIGTKITEHDLEVCKFFIIIGPMWALP